MGDMTVATLLDENERRDEETISSPAALAAPGR
jgi:hypothetical protein